jgi:hypothetical protein
MTFLRIQLSDNTLMTRLSGRIARFRLLNGRFSVGNVRSTAFAAEKQATARPGGASKGLQICASQWVGKRGEREQSSMHYLPLFAAITAGAVLIQTGILVALFVAIRKSISRMDVLVFDVKTKVTPIADTAKAMLSELKPKFTVIAANVSETTNIVRSQIEQVDAARSDGAARARLQLVRAEELIHKTKDHIHETRDLFHRGCYPNSSVVGVGPGHKSRFGISAVPPEAARFLARLDAIPPSATSCKRTLSYRRI